MKILRLSLLSVITIFCSISQARTHISWDDIQLGAARIKPTDTTWESSVTVHLAWTPVFQFNENIALRGELGFAWPEDEGNSRFLSVNYEGYVLVPVWTLLSAEAGAGFQYWKYAGGVNRPIVSVNAVFRIGEFIDRVFFGYQRYFLPGLPVDQFRSGIAFNIFR